MRFSFSGLNILLILNLFRGIQHVSSNGRLLEPPNRSSIWRFPEFKTFNPPINYNDNHLDCGGKLVPEDERNSCGICGDPISDPTPRPNEDGGTFGRGIIVRRYKTGQEINVTIQLTYGQKGFFEISLCASDQIVDHVDHNCYGKNVLLEKYSIADSAARYYNISVPLPHVTCANCVLRWRYFTGNNWGECGDGEIGGVLGCGPQQSFHGCSDIAIQ